LIDLRPSRLFFSIPLKPIDFVCGLFSWRLYDERPWFPNAQPLKLTDSTVFLGKLMVFCLVTPVASPRMGVSAGKLLGTYPTPVGETNARVDGRCPQAPPLRHYSVPPSRADDEEVGLVISYSINP
jgi:hypothetical protein